MCRRCGQISLTSHIALVATSGIIDRALQQFYSAPIILSKPMERIDDAEAQQTESSLPNAAL
jgi:hypothetical protein